MYKYYISSTLIWTKYFNILLFLLHLFVLVERNDIIVGVFCCFYFYRQ